MHSHSEHFISALSGIDEDNLKQQQEDSPVFQRDTPSDNNLNEMMVVLGHPERAKLFESVAKKALCLENVEFLLAVMKYQKEAARLLTHYSYFICEFPAFNFVHFPTELFSFSYYNHL